MYNTKGISQGKPTVCMRRLRMISPVTNYCKGKLLIGSLV